MDWGDYPFPNLRTGLFQRSVNNTGLILCNLKRNQLSI